MAGSPSESGKINGRTWVCSHLQADRFYFFLVLRVSS